MHLGSTLVASFLLSAAASAGDGVQGPWKSTAPEPRRGVEFDRERVYHDVAADGRRLACGATYKAEFDAHGATYVPFLGSRAPRNYPVILRLESMSVGGSPVGFAPARPELSGDTIRLERGSVVELYELAPRSIEQKLVFPSLPDGGDLLVRYAVESDLAASAATTGPAELAPSAELAAVEFANELGAVRYGKATVLDAAGASAPAETLLVDGGIEIRVPAAFLAEARFPVTIDPVISTFSVDTSPSDTLLPDVAYDSSFDRYAFAFELVFSASDHDVMMILRDGSGGFVSTWFVDMTLTEYWANPKVANGNGDNAFLVVAQVGLPTSGARSIRGRLLYVSANFLTDVFPISLPDQSGDKLNPDVGGDYVSGVVSRYGVVWERVFSPGDRDVHAQIVIGQNTLFANTILIDNSGSTLDVEPSISEALGGSGWHHIAWRRTVGPSNNDLYAAAMTRDGVVALGSTAVATGIIDEQHPSASTSALFSGHWLLVSHAFLGGSDNDVIARLMNGTTVLDSVNLSSLEHAAGSGTGGEDQFNADADCDGASFAVVYAETYQGSGTDYDVYAATLRPVGNQLFLSEGHANLAFSGTQEDHPRIVAVAGAYQGAPGGWSLRTCATWDDQVASGNRDLEAALYDCQDFASFCFPGDDAIACPCGNPPASTGRGCNNSSNTGGAVLSQNGTASVATDTVVFTTSGERPTATSIVLSGDALANAVYGQGVRCVGGSLKRLYVKTASGGSITAPQPGDPSVSARSAALGAPVSVGATRYYAVYYRDPVVLGGCPATSAFNMTQSGAMTWRP